MLCYFVINDKNEFSKEQILEKIDRLTPREQKIIRLRYGIDDGKKRTLAEVGEIFGVTRERIRQIEKRILRKLKKPFKIMPTKNRD